MALGCASIFACSLSPLWQPLCVSCGSNQFIGVQFWGVARKKVQRQHALRGDNIAALGSASNSVRSGRLPQTASTSQNPGHTDEDHSR
jgi:hypothetical protein